MLTNSRSLVATVMFFVLWAPSSAMQPAGITVAMALHSQESGAGAPQGKLSVPAKEMAGRCITMVSPTYPQNLGGPAKASTVVVRAVIRKSGGVSPMRAISGEPALETAATNAVRLWRYKPFTRDGEPIDVTTDIVVDFAPGTPGGMVTHPNR